MSVFELLNKDASDNNILVMHKSKSGCCFGKNEFCEYIIETQITNVTSITLNKGDDVIVVPLNGTSNRELRKSIAKALMDNGYDPYYEDSWKGITVKDNYISLIGEMVPVSMSIDGEEVKFDKRCDITKACKLKGMIPFNTSTELTLIETGSGTTIGSEDGFESGNSSQLSAAILEALDSEGLQNVKVEVEEMSSHETYIVTLHVIGESSVYFNGSKLSSCGCYPKFV